MSSDDIILKLPNYAGQAIVESGSLIACPLLGTTRFISYCKDRGISIKKERLLRLERLGLFGPVFRVKTPNIDMPKFHLPIVDTDNWFEKGWAWDTTNRHNNYEIPHHNDLDQEGYYSIYQIGDLSNILISLTMHVHLDEYLDECSQLHTSWDQYGSNCLQYANSCINSMRVHDGNRVIPLLCQYISNRYYPTTQGDGRTIQVGGGSSSDKWVSMNGMRWDWREYSLGWSPSDAEKLFSLTPARLKHAYTTMAIMQASCDPLEKWYQLIQFVSLDERKKLKDKALQAETLRSGAFMLRQLYRDLYEDELPVPNEVTGKVINHIPELEIRKDTRRYLEFVSNRYHVNPQPKLALIVEGESEEAIVQIAFEQYFGAHPGKYGIEIIVLGGVGAATGRKKDDRFRAILRLVDYLHHHQTFTFLILDNENYSIRLKEQARKTKSRYTSARFATRAEYIRIWKDSLEFDNYSCTEIASALNKLSDSKARFTVKEIQKCAANNNSSSSLAKLYKGKTNYDLDKIKFNEMMMRSALSHNAKRKIEHRPIIKTLLRVANLASRNPLPTTYGTWQSNQASKYFGKIVN